MWRPYALTAAGAGAIAPNGGHALPSSLGLLWSLNSVTVVSHRHISTLLIEVGGTPATYVQLHCS